MQILTKERPILFSTTMVQALLDGRKRMTRRIVKPSPGMQSKWLSSKLLNSSPKVKLGRSNEADGYGEFGVQLYHPMGGPLGWVQCPYGSIGDVLWVRETWRGIEQDFGPDRIEYKATETLNITDKWRPSIFMPRAACRIRLKINDIKVERVQEITEDDVYKEGYNLMDCRDYGAMPWFKILWQQINGPDSWNSNPFVWVISFERINQ